MPNRDLILVGAATIAWGDYVASKAAGTLTDQGYIGGPITIDFSQEHHEVDVQQHLAPVRAVPQKRSVEIKAPLFEGDVEKLRVLMGQPTGNISGSGQNKTILLDPDAAEQYHQIAITGKGPGTTGVRTWTFWRAYAKGFEAIELKKNGEQVYMGTFACLYEEGSTGVDDFGKQVDA